MISDRLIQSAFQVKNSIIVPVMEQLQVIKNNQIKKINIGRKMALVENQGDGERERMPWRQYAVHKRPFGLTVNEVDKKKLLLSYGMLSHYPSF